MYVCMYACMYVCKSMYVCMKGYVSMYYVDEYAVVVCESRNLLAVRRQLHQLGKQLAEDSKRTDRPLRINYITFL